MAKDAPGVSPDPHGEQGKDMGCTEAIHELYGYLDGELTEDRRREISRHLDLCRPCAGAAEFEAELRQVIANRCKEHVPESLIHRVADSIRNEQQRPAGGSGGTPTRRAGTS